MAALRDALRSMAGPAVAIGVRKIDEIDVAALFPAEAAQVARAVPKRVVEFATGRALLRELIGERCQILVGPDRRPILPEGICGSLAHDDSFAVAAITSDPGVDRIGIDIESNASWEPDLAAAIVRVDEPGLDAHLAFTIKEATYKAWSTSGGPILEHRDVRVRLSGSQFRAEVLVDGAVLAGSFACVADHWLALVVDPAVINEDSRRRS